MLIKYSLTSIMLKNMRCTSYMGTTPIINSAEIQMGCIVEFNHVVKFNFGKNTSKQKFLIDALLKYSNLDMPSLAQLLDVPTETLRQVHYGHQILDEQPATELAQYFLLCFVE